MLSGADPVKSYIFKGFCSEDSRNTCLLQCEALCPISVYRYSEDFTSCLTETEEEEEARGKK
jgi:hypothetical protein